MQTLVTNTIDGLIIVYALTWHLVSASIAPVAAWNPVPGVAGYRLYYQTNNGPLVRIDCGTNTQWTGQIPAGAYNFSVSSYASNGQESAFSAWVQMGS